MTAWCHLAVLDNSSQSGKTVDRYDWTKTAAASGVRWKSGVQNLSRTWREVIVVVILNAPFVSALLAVDFYGANVTGPVLGYVTTTILGYYQLPVLVLASLMAVLLAAFPRLLRLSLGTAFAGFLSILFIDGLVYRTCKFHLDAFWIRFVLSDYRALGLTTTALGTGLGAFAVIIVVEFGIMALAQRLKSLQRAATIFIPVVLLAMGLSQAVHVVAYKRNDERFTALTPRFPFYLPLTSHRNAESISRLLPFGQEEREGEPASSENATLQYPLAKLRLCDSPTMPLPNVVIIMLESWRHDMMNRDVTPHIWSLAKRSVVFGRHYSTGNSTTCGVFGLFFGLDSTYWSAVKANSELVDSPVLIDVLTDRGYTFGVYADSNFERHKLKDTIFRTIDIHESFAGSSDDQRDADMAAQVGTFLEDASTTGGPFLLYAFFKASHNSYSYPKSSAVFRPAKQLNFALARGADSELYKNDYRNALHYDDGLVGGILATLGRLELMKNTIVVITTDHGESFNDNHTNEWGHGSNFTQYQVQVPLIIFAPDQEPRSVEYATSHVDIAPTLLQRYLGCLNDPADYSTGRNLFDGDNSPRPFVVGGYVDHAYVFGEDVHVGGLGARRYKFADINIDADTPSSEMVRLLAEQTKRFYVIHP